MYSPLPANRGNSMNTIVEVKGLIAILMNALDSECSLDDDNSRNGFAIILNAMMTKLKEFELDVNPTA